MQSRPYHLHLSWGWFVALGIGLILAGAFAWVETSAVTLVSVFFIGVSLLVGGILHVIHAFMTRSWSSFGFNFLSGLLYAVGGLMIMQEPVAGSVIITAILAAMLVLGGILRISIAARHRHVRGWWPLVIGGAVSVLVGAMLYATLPWSGFWLLGTLIAVELAIQGLAWLQFGLSLRRTGAAIGAPF
jgi:uncharacterized membrane protein HdeD (DUF308 family)